MKLLKGFKPYILELRLAFKAQYQKWSQQNQTRGNRNK